MMETSGQKRNYSHLNVPETSERPRRRYEDVLVGDDDILLFWNSNACTNFRRNSIKVKQNESHREIWYSCK